MPRQNTAPVAPSGEQRGPPRRGSARRSGAPPAEVPGPPAGARSTSPRPGPTPGRRARGRSTANVELPTTASLHSLDFRRSSLALPPAQDDNLVRAAALEGFSLAVGPEDFDLVDVV